MTTKNVDAGERNEEQVETCPDCGAVITEDTSCNGRCLDCCAIENDMQRDAEEGVRS